MKARYTIDGDSSLEARLDIICDQVSSEVQSRLPSARVCALVLGGGYGRGQGGVLREPAGDLPYNDMEFYVFISGNRMLNDCRFGHLLQAAGNDLSDLAGVHIEFKLDSPERFRQSRPSMFSYDLVAGHKIILGEPNLFRNCEHHLRAKDIPVSEATRLLFNRSTGLLLARQLLTKNTLGPGDSDFVGRNISKAKLALGDAVLTVFGLYHWDCLERRRRLLSLEAPASLPHFDIVRQFHSEGVEFKLHPYKSNESAKFLMQQQAILTDLALAVWLWAENHRLGTSYRTIEEYAASNIDKCPETASWRNFLLNLKHFGWSALFDPKSRRYPRERLLCSLPFLLRGADSLTTPEFARHVRRNLHSECCDWLGLCGAYNRLWPAFG